MKLDLHVHIKRNSSCAKQQPYEAVLETIANGIDGLALLDHKYHATDKDLPNSSILLLRGAEVHIKNKSKKIEDHVVIITEQNIPFPLKLDSNEVQFIETFKDSYTLTFLAHPFRRSNYIAFDLNRFTPDAIEILSPNTSKDKQHLIESLGFQHNMAFLSCSDSHKPGRIGKWYIEFDDNLFSYKNPYKSLVEIVKSRQHELHGTFKYQ